MCSCTPKISEITSTIGKRSPFAGRARYAGIAKPLESIVTEPASRPSVLVATALEATGVTATAKPCPPGTASLRRRGGVARSLRSMGAVLTAGEGSAF
jgi:hypothetical protein